MHSFFKNSKYVVSSGQGFDLSSFSTEVGNDLSEKEAESLLKSNRKDLSKLQQKFYAEDKRSLLCVFQAMDAAGKDSTVKAVFTGMNPAGFKVSSFKSPSKIELDHDYLWRCNQALPGRGMIGVFNRSHYEEVLVCKVHPEYVVGQNLPNVNSVKDVNDAFWVDRYNHIKNWENHLAHSGTRILKFFLNVSKDEQKNRFLSRIENQKKNWKFNFGDLKERALWPQYQEAYQAAIKNTATESAPWFVIPADSKPKMRAIVSTIIKEELEAMNCSYPDVGAKAIQEMEDAKKILDSE